MIHVAAQEFINKQSDGTKPERFRHVRAFLRSVDEQAPGAYKKLTLPQGNDEAPDPHFISVADAGVLLHHVRINHPEWLGAVALKLFTGVRSFEIGRMAWLDVVIEDRVVNIRSDVAKPSRGKRRRRVIDWWPDCLTDWLMLCHRKPQDRIVPAPVRVRDPKDGRTPSRLDNRFVRWTSAVLRPEMGALSVDLKKNDFRHTYATYGVAFHQSADLIALQMGHTDTGMLYRHYRNWTSVREAKEYFTLTPQNAECIHAERTTEHGKKAQHG